jgi:hypothetical protein
MIRTIIQYNIILGNLETLDTGLKEKGLDIRDELLRFYSENYSANLMQLTVYGKGEVLHTKNCHHMEVLLLLGVDVKTVCVY